MEKNTIKVYARIKRLKNKAHNRIYDIRQIRDHEEIAFNTENCGDYGFYKNSKHKFRFCTVFDESTTQANVFDKLAKPVVNSVLEGYNGTIFAYGQTGSGKTFSMTGASEYDTRGIIPRTIQYIFDYIKNSTTVLYNIYISYMEIYNENGYDLLNPKHRATYLDDLPRVTILEDAKGKAHMRNLGVISVASEREAMCLLFLGDTNRMIAETPMNMNSSRSHCIFTVYVTATMTEDGRVLRSKLHLVDLAGSERVNKTGISGSLLVDAKQINLSLHYLEQVIIALSDEKRIHVPYRNSFMTTVLKDSLGGNCLTAMLATMSLDPRNYEETVSTCKFAQRVAMVSSEVHINEEQDPESRICQLKMELENLKRELVLYKNGSMHSLKSKYEETKELTRAQVEECEEQVSSFIQSSSDKLLIEEDMAKIQTCFKIFKRIIKSQMEEISKSDNSTKSSLSDIIKQKDNEISILVHLLNKEKLKTKEAERNNSPILQEACPEISKSVSSLSEKESLEIFLRNDLNTTELNKCASTLKLKICQAKNIANRIKMCKNNIMSLKLKLRENINNPLDVSRKLMTHLKSQQDIYRENIIVLRNLKLETDHLNHAYQQEKVRVMKRFKDWWAKEKLKSSNHNLPTIPPFTEPSNFYQDEIQDPNMFVHKSMNNFCGGNYQLQDNMPLISDQYIPDLNQRSTTSDFSIDTFPSLYDAETSYTQFDEIPVSPEPIYSPQYAHIPSENNYNQQSFNNLSFRNEYQITASTNFMEPTELQSIKSNTNYLNQNQPTSNATRLNERLDYSNSQLSQNYNHYYPETIPKQFTPVCQVINQYPAHQSNVQYQNNIPQIQAGFSGNYHHYPENNQSNFIDYDLPEKLSSNSNMPRQSSEENDVYYRYYPENQNSVEQTECDHRSSSTSRSKSAESREVPQQNTVEDEQSKEYLNNIPLTGDAEVDEEIIAFYRAKQNIISGNK